MNERILVVDDEPKIVKLAQDYLERSNYVVAVAYDGTTALASARQQFNDAVTGYNNYREQFPNNIVAGMFSFQPAELFEIQDPAIREAPQVSFS